mgnify:CR=1 FL=1
MLPPVAGMAVVFIRYKWIQCISELSNRLHTLNAIALAVGLISCVGMTFVANFQVSVTAYCLSCFRLLFVAKNNLFASKS